MDSLFFVEALIFVARGHLSDIVNLLGVLAQDVLKVASGITTEHNVGTTTSHVRGDSDGSTAPGLGNDLSFTLMMLGIKDAMRDTLPIKLLREVLGGLHRGSTDQDR